MLLRLALLGSAGLLIAACAPVEPAPPPAAPSAPSDAMMCTMEYAPVCARSGNDERTFSNACMARRDGYEVVAQGECGAR
ncbi:hypothetical protein DYI37_00655 [Fulvimarina endophytica]|uniref:Kazal-like domain-containing protein n=1 Tax=Fulvimarina endophytica TaxID=2293836 RepID=A0A371X9Z7_9HYPH|nr:hypothetical protein [Fulvimarina endophytica]RFC66022.1 hypothetical protein DYI37_00655 [Fulvimarina endophytica]